VQQACTDPVRVLARNTEAFGDLICSTKANALNVGGEPIGIVAHHLGAVLPIAAKYSLSHPSRQAQALQEDHGIAFSAMDSPAINDLLVASATNPLDLKQALWLIIKYFKSGLAKALDDPSSDYRSDTLNPAATEIPLKSSRGLRHHRQEAFDGKLATKTSIVDPSTLQPNPLTAFHAGQDSLYGDLVAIDIESGNKELILWVTKDDVRDRALNGPIPTTTSIF
jgi:hypothetical protein